MNPTIHAKAAVTDAQGTFTIENIDVHPPAAGEVRVELNASGICHTDYDSLNWGRHMVMGHEGAGIVESVGEGVTRVKPGHGPPIQAAPWPRLASLAVPAGFA